MDPGVWWLVVNWGVPILGPPAILLIVRFIAWLPHWGSKGSSTTKWPAFIDSLDIVGWLFLTLAIVASAFGDLATSGASVEILKLIPGMCAIPLVFLLYVFTVQAQSTSLGEGKRWIPSHRFRFVVFLATIGGTLVAFQIRGNVHEAGGSHANPEASDIGHTGSAGAVPK